MPRALGGREDGAREARRDADRRGHRLPVQRLLRLAVARGRRAGVGRQGRVGGPPPQGPVPVLAGLMDGNGCSIGTHILSYKPGNCVSEFGFRVGCVFRFEAAWESATRNPASEWDVLSFCGLWRKLRPRSRAQNGMRFSAAYFRRICTSRRAISGPPRYSSRFCATLQTVRSPVRTRGYTQNDTFPMQYDAGSACAIRRGP